MEALSLDNIPPTKYIFFTGKGGVGKTSTACAVAVNMADQGKNILLISTDPASNLQDIFNTELTGQGVSIAGAPGLVAANLNPEAAAREYRESIISPYRGLLPDSVISNMEEQLSGSCTVEIAAFDQFSNFITDQTIEAKYDHIIFDTAPTGHTLRMLQLPSAWSNFISESTHGASYLGQLAGLQAKKDIYKEAVKNLADGEKTTLVLVARPEETPLLEANRSSMELKELGITNQILILNGLLQGATDNLSASILKQQQRALANLPPGLQQLNTYTLPLRSYNILGLEKIREFFNADHYSGATTERQTSEMKSIDILIEDIIQNDKKVIFTMGKGGVGKTTLAAVIALSLARRGVKVHLTSTDPADHLQYVINDAENISISKIDEKKELQEYQNEVLNKARETMSPADVNYIEEDLRSPCTQEIAVFRAFAEIVDRAQNDVVIIDTAPTGHTLLLLDATQSYHKEVERTKGESPLSVQRLLPRLRDERQTEVILVTIPEATPVHEAMSLRDDLRRSGIKNKWWIINQCLSMTETNDTMMIARSQAEISWIEKVSDISNDLFVAIPWLNDTGVDELLGIVPGARGCVEP